MTPFCTGKLRRATALLTLSVSLLPIAASATVFFDSAEIATLSTAVAHTDRAQSFVNSQATDSTTGFVSALQAFSGAMAMVGGAVARANATAIANFGQGGATGSFRNVCDLFVEATRPAGVGSAFAGGYSFRYDMSVSRRSRFRLDYDVRQNGDVGSYVLLSGPTTIGGLVTNPSRGNFQGLIDPGNYRLTIDTSFGLFFTNTLIQTGIGVQAAPALVDLYNFRISDGVPEPEVWAMLLAGNFAIGGSLRRRRRLAAVIA